MTGTRTILAATALVALCALVPPTGAGPGPRVSAIVQARDAATAAARVAAAGGEVTHELGIIGAVAARFEPDRLATLRRQGGVRVYEDRSIEAAKSPGGGGATVAPESPVPFLVGARDLQQKGIDGHGVTVAVLDTGLDKLFGLLYAPSGRLRVLSGYDAQRDVAWTPKSMFLGDPSGHGSHVTAVGFSSEVNPAGGYLGVAPDADLVFVLAFDSEGKGTYADVIRGIDWVVANRGVYGIRVLNLSLSAPPRSHYWEDPLNQAVMAAWRAGIVVVASAGNTGPGAMTVGVPGNVPYVITVGAMSDNFTPDDPGDDFLAAFSAAGPTVEGFVKPEVVAPGEHILGLMGGGATIAKKHPEYRTDVDHYVMSGTSQAAAAVSGVAALLLQAEPALTPDEVKCRLLASARPAVDDAGALAYSVFQQGVGLVDAWRAVASSAAGCANRGLDVDRDLAGVEHFGGRANQRPDGSFYLMDQAGTGFAWDGAYAATDAYLWNDAYLWSDAFLWNDAFLWSDAYLWNGAFLWNDAYLWSNGLTETMSVNRWVDPELTKRKKKEKK